MGAPGFRSRSNSCCVLMARILRQCKKNNRSSSRHNSVIKNPFKNHPLHCCPDAFALFRSFPFRYISFSTAFLPKVSTRRSFSFLRGLFRWDSSSITSSPLSAPPPSGMSSHSSSSASTSFLRRLLPVVVGFPPPILTFTRGGTANPNAFPTFARSSALMSNIFFSEYDAYACRYDRKPSLADWCKK
jgi:hypothetical protein